MPLISLVKDYKVDRIGRGKIWLGPVQAAHDHEFLLTNNINTVINVGAAQEYEKLPNVNYHYFKVLDMPREQISDYFDKAFDLIETCRANILIHCHAGVSRSATILAAWMLRKAKGEVGVESVLAYIKKYRPCVDPNVGFIRQLEDYYFELSSIHRSAELEERRHA